MKKGRLEAFSDGVFAIIITIMVLELRPPHGVMPGDLKALFHAFLSYVLSFIYIAIYWNNHHHLLHAAQQVNGKVLWANIHLLFWISLFPFTTSWAGESGFALWPVAFYGFVFMMAGIAYYILAHSLIFLHGHHSSLATAFGADWKGKLSVILYAVGIASCFIHPWAGFIFYAIVAGMWIIPDKRIEKAIPKNGDNS